jgi:hypothetical protein
MSFRSLASFGKRQEFVAISELLRRGYDVYQTLVDDQGIDCIIRKVVDGRPVYIDLQIKARSKDCKPYDAARFAAFEVKDPRENFLFMFYAEQLRSYWIIPSLDLVRLGSKNVKGKNVGKYHILLSGFREGKATINPNFEVYRDEHGFRKLESTFSRLGRTP